MLLKLLVMLKILGYEVSIYQIPKDFLGNFTQMIMIAHDALVHGVYNKEFLVTKSIYNWHWRIETPNGETMVDGRHGSFEKAFIGLWKNIQIVLDGKNPFSTK